MFFAFIEQFKGKVKYEVYFKCTVKTKKSLNKIIDIEKESLGGYMPILVPMTGKTCKSSLAMDM